MPGETYTTYLRTELDQVTRQSYAQLDQLAATTYANVRKYAQEAGLATEGAFDGQKSSRGFQSLQTSANTVLGAIRRDAVATSAVIATTQQQISNLRTQAFSKSANDNGAIARSAAAANDNLGASMNRLTGQSSRAATQLTSHGRNTRALADETSKLSRGLDVLGTTLQVVQGPLGPISGRITAITSAMTSLTPVTLTLAGAATALFAFSAASQAFVLAESRLRPLYDTQRQVNDAMADTGRIALLTRTSLSSTVDLYSKLTAAGRDFGLSQAKVSRTVELSQKAASLSGGTAESREAGLYQFSQAIASNRFGGDELRSVLEQLPELGRAIAAGFKNADGSIGTTLGNLRSLGTQGKLTANAVVDALLRSGTLLDEKFAKLPLTIGAAGQQLTTTFQLMVGQVDQVSGVTSTLAKGISLVTQNLQLLLAIAGGLAARFVFPTVTGFIGGLKDATVQAIALRAQLAAAVAEGRATPLTPTGIGRAKAVTGLNDAAAAVNDARANVAANQEVIATLDKEIATIDATAQAEITKQTVMRTGAEQATLAAEARVRGLTEELTAVNALRAAYTAELEGAARARDLLIQNPSNNPQGTQNQFIAEHDAAVTATRLERSKADLTATATARQLVVAEGELAAAMDIEAAATITATQAANQYATKGFQLLALAEQRIAANGALAASALEAAAAETALTAAETRLTVAQYAYAAASTVAATAANVLKAGWAAMRTIGTGLMTFMGGPLNAALTLVAGAMLYLSLQTNAALDALHSFAGGQDELYRRLGITTDKLREQSDAARDLALSLGQAGLARAKATRTDANADLGQSLRAVAGGLQFGGNSADSAKVLSIANRLRSGQSLTPQGVGYISRLQQQYPDAFKSSGLRGFGLRMMGARPEDAPEKLLGTQAAGLNVQDAQKALQDIKTELAKPREAPKGPPVPLTADQFRARAEADARGDNLADRKAAATRTYQEKLAKIQSDPNLSDDQKRQDAEDAAGAYKRQTDAIDKRNAALANAAARKASAAAAKEAREEAAAREKAAQATEKLATIRGRYDEAPKAVDQARTDVRSLQRLVGQTVNTTNEDGQITGTKTYTQADQLQDVLRIAESLRKPFNDITKEYERQSDVQNLILQGRTAEAAALQQAYTIIDKVGFLENGQYETLIKQAQAQEALNDRIAERGKIVEDLKAGVDDLRNSTQQFLEDLEKGDPTKALKNLGKGLLDGFNKNSAKLLTDTLFSGVDRKVDDLINGKTALQTNTEFLGSQTGRAGTSVSNFADAVDGAIARVNGQPGGLPSTISAKVLPEGTSIVDALKGTVGAVNRQGADAKNGLSAAGTAADLLATSLNAAAAAANNMATTGGAGGPIGFLNQDPLNTVGSIKSGLGDLMADLDSALFDMNGGKNKNPADPNSDIVVTATVAAKKILDLGPTPAVLAADRPKTSLSDVYNKVGGEIGSKLDSLLGTNFAKGVGKQLGNALEGAQTGVMVANVGKALGIKTSTTGGAIGGAIGSVAGSFIPIPGGKEIGAVVGSIWGSIIGGLFEKTPKASAGVSVDAYGNIAASGATGTSKKLTTQADSLAGAVATGVQSIADALGVTISGSSDVKIGTYKGAYRVNDHGGAIGGVTGSGAVGFGDDQQAAIEFAIKSVIEDSVLTGISQASINIIKSGQDIQRAIQKALMIESIPKDLLKLTDPVRSAVNDLNDQFGKIISALNEGGATAEQYAQAQQLYDIERAQAISQAQKAATGAIDDYLRQITATTASPLNKATVYSNAQTNLSKVTTDFAAGKATQDDLVQAAKDFQDASRALYGSSESFFEDFQTLQDILNTAKTKGQVIDSTNAPDLPGSPFDSAAVQNAISGGANAQVAATNNQTDVLNTTLQQILDRLGVSAPAVGGAQGNSIDYLPGFV